MPADILLRLKPEGDAVTVSLGSYLGTRFSLYRDAVAQVGGRYDAGSRTNLVTLSAVPELLRALETRGFSSVVDQAVADRLKAGATEARALADAGELRLQAADARLAGTGRSLYPYQRSGVKWLAPRKAALLADAPGLGKSCQALLSLPEGAATVVVCPAAVLISWQREVETWRPDLYPTIIKSSSSWRWPRTGEVILCTYGATPQEGDVPSIPGYLPSELGDSEVSLSRFDLQMGAQRHQQGKEFRTARHRPGETTLPGLFPPAGTLSLANIAPERQQPIHQPSVGVENTNVPAPRTGPLSPSNRHAVNTPFAVNDPSQVPQVGRCRGNAEWCGNNTAARGQETTAAENLFQDGAIGDAKVSGHAAVSIASNNTGKSCAEGGVANRRGSHMAHYNRLVLIGDELHNCKNPKTARTRRWRALANSVSHAGGVVWGLTATPLLNRPPELWAVLASLGLAREAFGSWPRFVALFEGQKDRWGGYEWGEVSDEVPLALQKVSLHRRRLDVLPDLPTKRRAYREVNGLDRETLAACDAVLEALRAKGLDLEALPDGTDVGDLISGPVFELMSRARAMLASAKIPAALEIVESYEEAGEPLVVASAHLEPLRIIGSRPGWGIISGEVSAEERGRIVEEFQAGRLKGVALSYAAGGVGITLTRSAHVLCVDLPWTSALLQQAEDRTVRIGQTRGVLVEILVALHPLDERVSHLLAAKAALIEAAVEASAVSASETGQDTATILAEAAERAAASVASPAVDVRPADEVKPEPRKRFTPETIHEAPRETIGKFRPAAGPVELHAAKAILLLASCDEDRARQRNGEGFNQRDSEFGHSLAEALASYGRLSDRQWACAVKMAAFYHRQVGPAPTA